MKLLIVDDSPVVRGIVARTVRAAQLDFDALVEADSGLEALRRIVADPAIEVVLCDVNMPCMNGVEFVQALRRSRAKASIVVLLLTSENTLSLAASALSDGANGVLVRPFTAEMLRAALEPLSVR